MTHTPTSHTDLPPVEREVCIYPSDRAGQYRLEYDRLPDSTFRSQWVRSEDLIGVLARLLPYSQEDELQQAHSQMCDLDRLPKPTVAHLSLRGQAPEPTPLHRTPVEVRDFTW